MMADEVSEALEGLPSLLTVKETAAVLRMHHQTVRKYVRDKALSAVRVNQQTVRVTRSSLAALLRKR